MRHVTLHSFELLREGCHDGVGVSAIRSFRASAAWVLMDSDARGLSFCHVA